MSTASTGADASADEMLRFGVLGPLEVWQGARLIDLPGRKERALLALLLTAPGRVFSVPAIVEGIWGTRPPVVPSTRCSPTCHDCAVPFPAVARRSC